MYKNAKEGVKKLYYSAICGIITMGLSLASLLFTIFGLGGDAAFVNLMAGLFGSLALILSLAGFLFEIIGCYEASKDKNIFLLALYSAIAAIIFTSLAAIFKSFIGVIFTFLASVSSLLVSFFIIRGLMFIFTDLDDIEMVMKGRKVLLIFGISFIVSILTELTSGILNKLEFSALVTNILAFASGIIAIISCVFYMMYVKESLTHLEFSTFEPNTKEEVIEAEVKDIETKEEEEKDVV